MGLTDEGTNKQSLNSYSQTSKDYSGFGVPKGSLLCPDFDSSAVHSGPSL